MNSPANEQEPVDCGMVIVRDSREQKPYEFTGLIGDHRFKFAPLIVRTETQGLKAGDYSVKGFENNVAVERKSLSDAYQTLIHERVRFEAELERLMEYDASAVVIEADWFEIETYRPPFFNPKRKPPSLVPTILTLMQRYPCDWLTAGSRAFGQYATFYYLERFVRDVKSGERVIRDRAANAVA